MDSTLGIIASPPLAFVGASAAPEAEQAPAARTEFPLKYPVFGLITLGGSIFLGAAMLRAANPFARIGGGLLGLGLAAAGAMMLTMGGNDGSSTGTGSSGPVGNSGSSSGPSGPSGTGSVPAQLAFNQERRAGPTPNGGDYSIASYFDDAGDPIAKADATSVLIAEYSSYGSLLSETTGSINRGG